MLWLVTFMEYDLGYFDDETAASNRSRIPSVGNCYLCLRNGPLECVSKPEAGSSDPVCWRG